MLTAPAPGEALASEGSVGADSAAFHHADEIDDLSVGTERLLAGGSEIDEGLRLVFRARRGENLPRG